MNPGKFNQLVTVQRENRTADNIGGDTVNWVDVKQVWAEIKALSGNEAVAARRVQGSTVYKIKMRPEAGVTLSHRLRWDSAGGTLMNIRRLDPIGRGGAFIEIIAESGVAE